MPAEKLKTAKTKPRGDTRTSPQIPPSAEAFGAAVGEVLHSVSGLKIPFSALSDVQAQYIDDATRLWNESLQSLSAEGEPRPKLSDRRFSADDWANNPGTAFMAQMYLLNARTLMQLADAVEGDAKTRQRVRFAVQQWIDAVSPANYLALNPEALRMAIETKGESIAQGMQHLWQDLQAGRVSQTDVSLFEVGRNMATTEGSVVFENELFQLLEYKPLTAQVFERPLLMVPPCINKYYILDLQPENSLVRYAVEQGHRVFMVSWRNADESMAARTWDDYVEHGVMRAIQGAREIAQVEQIDTLGFCIGGTLLATALAVFAARGQKPASSMTLLTTFLDFTHAGLLDIFVDEPMVQMREMTIGEQAPGGPHVLKGKELAATFSFLRPNDLVWNYVVGNYLKGETPPPFDLLYWNGDSTNLPGPMYCWYLRNTYLENNLIKPGKVTVCGEKLDLRLIDTPTYVYGSREDHIVPWEAAYENTQVLKHLGPRNLRFVLGASGHIAGVINPASKNKRCHWISPKAGTALPAEPSAWMAGAKELPGSWWVDWSAWLKAYSGKKVAAPKATGGRGYKVIEPAPGRYVKQPA